MEDISCLISFFASWSEIVNFYEEGCMKELVRNYALLLAIVLGKLSAEVT